jgi:hypothetical protein
MMWRKYLAISLVLVLCAIPVTGLTWAPAGKICEQGDLEGIWNVEVWAGDPSGNQRWDQCTLTIDADGFIAPQGTYTDFMGDMADVTGGQLTISADCVVEGTIDTSTGTLHVERGGIVENRLILDKQ